MSKRRPVTSTKKKAAIRRTLDARRDTLDFRDRMFEPTLVEVPVRRPLETYLEAGVPILDQGSEGACTGFGLATVVHYLLQTRKVVPDRTAVSPRMLYDMARRYDEWPGEKYDGSSARGAMKGWHKHGVCSAEHWRYQNPQDKMKFTARFEDALRRPLGAYLRVNHKDIVAMHSAISEVGALYATADVHSGWDGIGSKGIVNYDDTVDMLGGHAFAIVAYDERGFWIQNSWGNDWGYRGFGLVSYDDWLANGSDVWVARLGAPIELRSYGSVSRGVSVASAGSRSYVFSDLRPHIISLGNDGLLRTEGTYGTSADDVNEIFEHVGTQTGTRPHLLLYAHGGLTAEDSAIQKVADLRGPLLDAGVYPLSLVWKTDFWTTLKNILQESVARRRPEGFVDAGKDFMLDRLDDALEPLARVVGGKAQWDEMKENATLAGGPGGGLIDVAKGVAALRKSHPALKVHMVGHSAGSILLGALLARLKGVSIETCTLWAPACTMNVYRTQYLPAIRAKQIKSFGLFTLSDKAERDDHCARIYHKSLLYLVSNAFESRLRKPSFRESDGDAILGMAKFVDQLPKDERPADWVLSPNAKPAGSRDGSTSTTHGGFDDDQATLLATLARILGKPTVSGEFRHGRSGSANRDRRADLVRA
jgi:pimeloyl-ACP methyl ester carboxylesterase